MRQVPREKFKVGQIVKAKFGDHIITGKIQMNEGFIYLCNNETGTNNFDGSLQALSAGGQDMFGYKYGFCFLLPRAKYTHPCDEFFLPRDLSEIIPGDMLHKNGFYTFVYGKEGNHVFCSTTTRDIKQIDNLAECDFLRVKAYSISMLNEACYEIVQDIPSETLEVSLEEIAKWKGVDVKDIRIKE